MEDRGVSSLDDHGFVQRVDSLAGLFSMRAMHGFARNPMREQVFCQNMSKQSGLSGAVLYECTARGKPWIVVQHDSVEKGEDLTKQPWAAFFNRPAERRVSSSPMSPLASRSPRAATPLVSRLAPGAGSTSVFQSPQPRRPASVTPETKGTKRSASVVSDEEARDGDDEDDGEEEEEEDDDEEEEEEEENDDDEGSMQEPLRHGSKPKRKSAKERPSKVRYCSEDVVCDDELDSTDGGIAVSEVEDGENEEFELDAFGRPINDQEFEIIGGRPLQGYMDGDDEEEDEDEDGVFDLGDVALDAEEGNDGHFDISDNESGLQSLWGRGGGENEGFDFFGVEDDEGDRRRGRRYAQKPKPRSRGKATISTHWGLATVKSRIKSPLLAPVAAILEWMDSNNMRNTRVLLLAHLDHLMRPFAAGNASRKNLVHVIDTHCFDNGCNWTHRAVQSGLLRVFVPTDLKRVDMLDPTNPYSFTPEEVAGQPALPGDNVEAVLLGAVPGELVVQHMMRPPHPVEPNARVVTVGKTGSIKT